MTTTSASFVGFVPNTKEGINFLSDLRKVFRGTGMKVIRYARNPNREQFYANEPRRRGIGGGLLKHYYCQNLPLQHATHYALYARDSKGYGLLKGDVREIKSKTIYDTMKKIYKNHKINLDVVSNLTKSGNYLPKK